VLRVREFLRDTAQASGDDYATAFKLLGLVVFVAQEGIDPLLSGRLISPRTFHRWADSLKTAGWGDLLTEARLRLAVRDFVKDRLGGLPPALARERVVEAARVAAESEEALSPQAVGRQASDAVKGLAEGREAKPSALDGVAAGGSLREATAPADGEGVTPAL